VAEVCKAIKANKEKVFEYTNKWNNVAVVSDGTRILGLGDIGPEAGMPVMEGKALLFKYLGGVDAYPICLDTKDPDELIKTVLNLQPSFGGVNLEDIALPKCFYILEELRKRARIPVWHDDQQGTATIALAGLTNALKVVGKKMDETLVSMIGAGSANTAVLKVLIAAGVKPGNVIMCDISGILHPDRKDFESGDPRYNFCQITNGEGRKGGMPEAMKGTDVCIAYSAPGPGTIKKEWVASMATDPIIFSCANPVPEIWPWEAKEGGAKIVATGRSDFPNQVNNSLGFPGIFRGVLDVRAKMITDEMCVAAAEEVAKVAEEKGLSEKYIIPDMDEWEVYPKEAVAVGMKAIEQGIAKVKLTKDELYEKAERIIKRSREQTQFLMRHGFIKPPPEER
jgi:Malic enzyme